jgi:hypothetical protein
MTLRLLVAALCALVVACGYESPAARCELGRSLACVCPGGAPGAQECGPSGVWGPCACAAPDAAPVDVVDADPVDVAGPDPVACRGPCASANDCERSCRVSATDPSSYCCVEGRCVAGMVACPGIPSDARLCSSGLWAPVCERLADCALLCGDQWSCVRPSTGLPRCARTSPPDAGADAAADVHEASRDAAIAVDVPRDVAPDAPCTAMCGGRCADTTRDPANCGACGVGCPARTNATGACASSSCAIACNAGFADCDGRAANGCEADLSTPMFCGSCATLCRPGVACAGGACTGCLPNMGDCDGLPANGCEADLRYDAFNCGACGRACSGSCFGSACR